MGISRLPQGGHWALHGRSCTMAAVLLWLLQGLQGCPVSDLLKQLLGWLYCLEQCQLWCIESVSHMMHVNGRHCMILE